jgi:hypothetical protein
VLTDRQHKKAGPEMALFFYASPFKFPFTLPPASLSGYIKLLNYFPVSLFYQYIVFILDMTPYIMYFKLQLIYACLFSFNPIGLRQTRAWTEESFYITVPLFCWEVFWGSTVLPNPLPATAPLQSPPLPLSSMT